MSLSEGNRPGRSSLATSVVALGDEVNRRDSEATTIEALCPGIDDASPL